MVYCWKCGTEAHDDAGFCHKCGAQLRPVAGLEGRTGFEQLRDDRTVQDHWLKRVIAYVIDVVTVAVLVSVVALVAAIPLLVGGVTSPALAFVFPGTWALWLLVIPFLVFGYFILADMFYGGTLGKHVMGLRVQRTDGRSVDFGSALLRNLSKVNFVLLLLDMAAGLGMRGEMSQKFSDRYVGTKVETVHTMRIIT